MRYALLLCTLMSLNLMANADAEAPKAELQQTPEETESSGVTDWVFSKVTGIPATVFGGLATVAKYTGFWCGCAGNGPCGAATGVRKMLIWTVLTAGATTATWMSLNTYGNSWANMAKNYMPMGWKRKAQ